MTAAAISCLWEKKTRELLNEKGKRKKKGEELRRKRKRNIIDHIIGQKKARNCRSVSWRS